MLQKELHTFSLLLSTSLHFRILLMFRFKHQQFRRKVAVTYLGIISFCSENHTKWHNPIIEYALTVLLAPCLVC